MINKPKLSEGVTCSMDKLNDLLIAEEPNDEFYHDFENIEQFLEQLEMKLQMTYQQN
jgi:hypothetical protein